MRCNYVCDSCYQEYLYDPGSCPYCQHRPIRYTGNADREAERERERERARQAQRERDAAQRAQAEKSKSPSKTKGGSGSGCGCLVMIIFGLIVAGLINSKNDPSNSTSTKTTANNTPSNTQGSKPTVTKVPQFKSSVQPRPSASISGAWAWGTPTPKPTATPAPSWPSFTQTQEPTWKTEVRARLDKGRMKVTEDKSVTPHTMPVYGQTASDTQVRIFYKLNAGEYYALTVVGDDSNTSIESILLDSAGNQIFTGRNVRGGAALHGSIQVTGTYTLVATIRCTRGMCGYGSQGFRIRE